MAKRTTEAVLRGEISAASKALDQAKKTVVRRLAEKDKATELLALAKNEETAAKDALLRAENSLAAYLPEPTPAVDQPAEGSAP